MITRCVIAVKMDAVRPFFEFMYRKYWCVQMTGVDNITLEIIYHVGV